MFWPENLFDKLLNKHILFARSIRTLIYYVCVCLSHFLPRFDFLFPSCRWSRRVVLWSNQQIVSTANLLSHNEQVRTMSPFVLWDTSNACNKCLCPVFFKHFPFLSILWPNVLPSATFTYSIWPNEPNQRIWWKKLLNYDFFPRLHRSLVSLFCILMTLC